MITFGQRGRDKDSGFEGMVVGRVQFVNFDYYALAPIPASGADFFAENEEEAKEYLLHKYQEARWFDRSSIEIIDPGVSDLWPEDCGGQVRRSA